LPLLGFNRCGQITTVLHSSVIIMVHFRVCFIVIVCMPCIISKGASYLNYRSLSRLSIMVVPIVYSLQIRDTTMLCLCHWSPRSRHTFRRVCEFTLPLSRGRSINESDLGISYGLKLIGQGDVVFKAGY
jgi:hypothetical protein